MFRCFRGGCCCVRKLSPRLLLYLGSSLGPDSSPVATMASSRNQCCHCLLPSPPPPCGTPVSTSRALCGCPSPLASLSRSPHAPPTRGMHPFTWTLPRPGGVWRAPQAGRGQAVPAFQNSPADRVGSVPLSSGHFTGTGVGILAPWYYVKWVLGRPGFAGWASPPLVLWDSGSGVGAAAPPGCCRPPSDAQGETRSSSARSGEAGSEEGNCGTSWLLAWSAEGPHPPRAGHCGTEPPRTSACELWWVPKPQPGGQGSIQRHGLRDRASLPCFALGSPCHWAVAGDGLSCLSLSGTQAVVALGQDLWKAPLASGEDPDLLFPP